MDKYAKDSKLLWDGVKPNKSSDPLVSSSSNYAVPSTIPSQSPSITIRSSSCTLPTELLDMENAVDRADRALEKTNVERKPEAERLGAA